MFSALRDREAGRSHLIQHSDAVNKSLYKSYDSLFSWKKTVESGSVYNLQYSPDGSVAIGACEKDCFIVLDGLTGQLIKYQKDAHDDCVNNLTFIDSALFATCSDDESVALWDLRNLKHPILRMRNHDWWVKNVQYIHSVNRLMTAGFDGRIYLFDISRGSADDIGELVYQQEGLLRACVVPDEDQLVMSTDSGLLILINDLDFEHLLKDTETFDMNRYIFSVDDANRVSMPDPKDWNAFSRQRNQIELFHSYEITRCNENTITGLTVHPHGWCALSRCTVKNFREWSVIHDIQPMSSDLQDDIDEDIDPDKPTVMTQIASPFPSNENDDMLLQEILSSLEDSDNNFNDSEGSSGSSSSGEPSFSNQVRLNTLAHFQMGEIEETVSPEVRCVPLPMMRVIDGPTFERRFKSIFSTRLQLFISEPCCIRGYIKEPSFSPDGRIIASPFANCIRLLAFNENVSELSHCVPRNIKELYDFKLLRSHNSAILCTCFSPLGHKLAAGCKDGEVTFYQPVL